MNNPGNLNYMTDFVSFSDKDYEKNTIDTSFSARSKLEKKLEFERIKKQILAEFFYENWDYEGALPITPKVLDAAENLVEALDWDMTFPNIFPSPNGKVAMSWNKDDKTLNLTINEAKDIAYSYLSNETNFYGESKFSGLAIPKVLSLIILSFND